MATGLEANLYPVTARGLDQSPRAGVGVTRGDGFPRATQVRPYLSPSLIAPLA